MSVDIGMEQRPINVPNWLHDNHHRFLPPVSNHFMHLSGQLSVMYVGGANQRSDYHVQKGEELFFMLKGDMVLKVVVQGRKVDVPIKEGEIFLLPNRIPHSPQRIEGTMGLVLERMRNPQEIDVLRFYTASQDPEDLTVLFERYFHWNDVKTKMVECLNEFRDSEEFRTGVPKQQYAPPFEVNSASDIMKPFNLHHWMRDNATLIDQKGFQHLFDPTLYKQNTIAYGLTTTNYTNDKAETWFHQYKGTSEVTVEGEKFALGKDDTYLLPVGKGCHIQQEAGNYLLSFSQDP